MTSWCSNKIKEILILKHGLVSRTYSKKSLIMASIFSSKSKSFMTMSIPPQDEPSTNRLVQPNKSFDDKSDKEEEEETNPKNIKTTPPSPLDPLISLITEKVCKLNSFLKSSSLVPRPSDTKFVCTEEDDRDVMFIETIKKYDDSHEEELEVEVNAMTEGLGVEYFDTFPTRS
ncbi:hypothetical protein Tco_0138745 [Tanacetum coccineum]